MRTVVPVDKDTVIQPMSKIGLLIVVDEDYRMFGLSGYVLYELVTVLKYTLKYSFFEARRVVNKKGL